MLAEVTPFEPLALLNSGPLPREQMKDIHEHFEFNGRERLHINVQPHEEDTQPGCGGIAGSIRAQLV